MKKSNLSQDDKQNKKTKKQNYIDDGHTVYNMDGVRSPFDSLKKNDDGAKLSRAEKWAAIRAALQVYFPLVLGAIACFAVVGVLMYFWLS